MYVSLGARSPPAGLVEMLLECHGRIRSFAELARTVGERPDAPEAEVVEACVRCERYFREALPLHVADEERSLLPRLRGRTPDLDVALASMGAQHREHDDIIAALLDALGRVRATAGDVEARAALHRCASRAVRDLEAHLALEEAVVFPAVREMLDAREQAAVVAELRGRRGVTR